MVTIGKDELTQTLADLNKQRSEALQTVHMCEGAILQVTHFLEKIEQSEKEVQNLAE